MVKSSPEKVYNQKIKKEEEEESKNAFWSGFFTRYIILKL